MELSNKGEEIKKAIKRFWRQYNKKLTSKHSLPEHMKEKYPHLADTKVIYDVIEIMMNDNCIEYIAPDWIKFPVVELLRFNRFGRFIKVPGRKTSKEFRVTTDEHEQLLKIRQVSHPPEQHHVIRWNYKFNRYKKGKWTWRSGGDKTLMLPLSLSQEFTFNSLTTIQTWTKELLSE